MKKIIVFAMFILALGGFASAQTPREVFDKVKELKLLEDNRNDVKRVLVNYEIGDFDETHFDYFFTDSAKIEVSYSDGNCIEDEDDDEGDDEDINVAEIWNVAEWKATKIIIDFEVTVTVEEIGYDLSKLEKEKRHPDWENSQDFIYSNKNSGIAFFVDEEDRTIEKIILYPAKSSYSSLCDNEKAKKFASAKGWFGDYDLQVMFDGNLPSNVTDLILSATEINAPCGNKKSSDKAYKISVKTVANDPENDVLTYNYEVSGGRIIGQGANVVWDLTGVKPGTYTITAATDDGCGICGTTKTQTVIVNECAKRAEK